MRVSVASAGRAGASYFPSLDVPSIFAKGAYEVNRGFVIYIYGGMRSDI